MSTARESHSVARLRRGLISAAAVAFLLPARADGVDFAKDIAPLFERQCLRCHHPGESKGDLSLATRDGLIADGHVVPGKPDESPLLDLVTSAGGRRPAMPKEGRPLSAEQVATLRAWVAAGAPWPAEVVLRLPAKADRSWWSLRPLAADSLRGPPEPPAPPDLPADWGHPIDRFVFARLRENGLAPSPPAERPALIRRLTYDLTGLPPTPEQVTDFEQDAAPDAYERLVERLLASPRYGERWGRHWLDVARFGESIGYERNLILDSAWPFRDYVVRSFNSDKPFDRLMLEHLAGDLVGPGDPDAETGTGFLVAGPYDNVGNQDAAQAAVIRADTLDEIVRATGEAFLGMTVGCARCHDHKFDPIPTADYYALTATFAGVYHGNRVVGPPELKRELAAKTQPLQAEKKRLTNEKTRLRKESPPVQRRIDEIIAKIERIDRELAELPPPGWWVGQFKPAPGPFYVFHVGDPQKKGPVVQPASPSLLDVAPSYRLANDGPEADRRLALARWIVAADNPLTPRVLANRLWHYHFGTGLVDTPSDFGFMGGKPTHPELLDWLARQVHAYDWRLKPLHRLIVTSQTYRQSAADRPDAARVDGGSRLLWRFPPRRLSGEEVRDTMLAVAGRLDGGMGGPGFRLYRYVQDNVATYVPVDAPGPETYRRAVYHQNARAARVDVLSEFDCPDPAAAAPRRAATTTPLQALTMLNNRFALDMAEALAERLRGEAGADDAAGQVRRAFALAFARPPTRDELDAALTLVRTHGLRAFCRALLNTNELVTLD